ncbi:hypothetical protein Bca52824_083810 [Brassica carinata]|uniref:Uncharacterized protein n=1 Tax=Brassica carinata TaxID=52824 RepID=A0A8X7PQ98_BRACI|nr:hypothetical protein Bca52824_083810 [Brassica carinata]
MGDPFGDEYKNQMKSVREEQLILLEKFHELAVKLDSKKKILKRKRRWVTIVYATAAMSFLAVEICLFIVIPPLGLYTALGVATGLNYVIGTVGVLVHKVLKKREKDLDKQKEVVNKMKDNTNVNIQATNTIHSLVEKLINSLSLILGSVERAVVKKEEEAVKPVMDLIRDEVDTFATAIKEVGEAVATCSTCISSSIKSMAAVGLVSQLLSKYSSSDKNGTNEPNLISYTTACEEDPELKSFGSSLDQRFSKLNRSLTTGVKTENFSLHAVKSVCGFLVEMNQNLVENIIANVDLLKNEELRSLVDLYYESSTSTLDLFNTVGNCTNKAKLSILIIRIAIQQFEKESMDTEIGRNKKKYAETLEELNKVKARGDPFGDEFKDQLKSVRAEHLKILEKVHEQVMKLDKQQGKLKRRRRLTTIFFSTMVLSFLAVEICSNIVGVPPLVQGLYLNEMMKNREKDLDRQKEVVNIMEKNTNVNIQWTNTINSLVEKLTTSLSLILGSMELAVVKREEEAAKPLVEAILKEVDAFASTIQEAEICSNIVGVPPLVQGTAFGLNLLMTPLGLYLNEMMKNREKDLDRQKEVVNIMEKNTNVNIQWTNTINSLVEKLTTSLSLILGSMELAVVKREEEAAKPLVEAILKEVDAFASTIQEAGEAVAKCISCVASGKLQVLEHITNSMSL